MYQPPVVTIVTPSYNQGEYLRRTIDSVLQQTYEHIEYIVMDGGSTDDSVDILRSYGDRIHWVSEKDRGQTHAINKGFENSRGCIRAYLNSDDVLLPRTVERVVDYFERHQEWQFLYGRSMLIDADDRGIGEYATKPFSMARLAEDSCISQPATFWRTCVSQKIGGFREELHYCMDYDYWLRAAKMGFHIQYVEDVLAKARIYAETKSIAGAIPAYRESIRVCYEHVGQVTQGPFLGLWQMWLDQKMMGLPSGLRFRLARAMASCHRQWFHWVGGVC